MLKGGAGLVAAAPALCRTDFVEALSQPERVKGMEGRARRVVRRGEVEPVWKGSRPWPANL